MKFDWWTLALQTINVVVLLWVLQRFLFKPVRAIIAQRQQAVQALTDAATEAKAKAEQTRAALDAERAELSGQRDKVLAGVHQEAQTAREALLAKAAQEAQQRLDAGRATLARERGEAQAALRSHAVLLAGDMARQLLQRLPPARWNRPFLEAACAELAALPVSERESLQRGDGDSTATVLSADALSSDDQSFVRDALAKVFGRAPALTFAVDAQLIAGVELRFHHLIIRNHWAADLERLTTGLQRDDDAARPA